LNKNLWWSYSLQPVTSVWVSPASCCKGLLFEPMDVFSRMCLLSSIWWLMAPCVPEPVEIGTEWIEHFAIMWIDLLMDRWLKLACLNFGISKSSISRDEECRLHFSFILCWKVAEDSNGRVLASNQSFHRFLLPDQMKENLQFNYWNQHINEMASLVCSKKYLKWSIYHTGLKLSDNIKDS
jgi:hypothetical protein